MASETRYELMETQADGQQGGGGCCRGWGGGALGFFSGAAVASLLGTAVGTWQTSPAEVHGTLLGLGLAALIGTICAAQYYYHNLRRTENSAEVESKKDVFLYWFLAGLVVFGVTVGAAFCARNSMPTPTP